MRRVLGLLALAAGCAPTTPDRAARWPTHALVEAARDGGASGGFPASTFITLKGQPLPFRGPDYESPPALAISDGWAVLPAFGVGQPAAYVVSEVWEHHPDPWIQPVYMLVSSFDPGARQRVDGVLVPIVFGVGEDSSFYSPFWEGFMVQTHEPAPARGLPDVRAVLAAAREIRPGVKPLCPITPDGFSVAAAGQIPVHPLTRAPLQQVVPSPVNIDGATPSYVDFGPERFEVTPTGVVVPTRIFFFTRAGKLLELPAVLSDDAVRSSYARRFDVVLDREEIFVPAGAKWDAVRAKLKALPVDPAIPADTAAAYALRVARTPECFTRASSFPSGCQWLDSEAAIDGLEPHRVIRTETTLSAVPMHFGGEPL